MDCKSEATILTRLDNEDALPYKAIPVMHTY